MTRLTNRFFVVLTMCVCMLGTLIPAFAGGLRETEFQDTKGDRNWEYEFDINDKKPGVYNIVVEAKDAAGNVQLAGPINVYIDPNSDLPVITLANPLQDMRVGGDLNIVGTCVDDDAVDRVEISIDGGEWVVAEGKDFWRYYVAAGDIPDGRRTLKARGVDINGLVGKEYSVSFHMDKNKPLASFTSHEPAQLVAGRITLKGYVYDANGVERMEVSLDEGSSWQKVTGPFDKKTNQRSFSIPIDTTKLKDGPGAILIRAVDGCGSVGITPFLLVFDNTKPEVDLVSPGPDDTVDTDFVLFGVAGDDVGLAALSWKIGDLGGDLALTPGDPYWTVPVSIPDLKDKQLQLVVTAKDIIGNVTEIKRTIKVDLEKDKPVVTILSPLADSSVEGTTLAAIQARDDDGIAAIEYWLGSAAPTKIDTTGALALPLEGLAFGANTLSVRAIDIKGVGGPVSTVTFNNIGVAPAIEPDSLQYTVPGSNETVQPYSMGLEVRPDSSPVLRVKVSGGMAPSVVSWTIADTITGSFEVKTADEQLVSISLPALGPYGLLPFEVEMKDSSGRSAKTRAAVYLTNFSAIRAEPSFVFEDARLDDKGMMRFGVDSRPLIGRFVGAELASVSLEPASKLVTVSRDGPWVQIAVQGEGLSGPHTLVAKTDKGHEFRSSSFSFTSDVTGPALSLDPLELVQFKDRFNFAGKATDALEISSLLWDLGGREGNLRLSNGRFTGTLDTSSVSDGNHILSIYATDKAGNTSVLQQPLLKDSTPPEIVLLSPSPDAPSSLISGYVRDAGGVKRLSYAIDGRNFMDLDASSTFLIAFQGDDPTKVVVRAEDFMGNVTEYPLQGLVSPADVVLPEAADSRAVPSVSILQPTAEGRVDSRTILVFRVSSQRELSSITWSFGSQKGELSPWDLIPQGNSWLGFVQVRDYQASGGSVQASVSVKDSAGKGGSATVRCNADFSATTPAAEISSPAEGAVVSDTFDVLLRGTGGLGVASFQLSVDNAEARTIYGQGAAVTTLQKLSPGNHTLTVRAVDAYGRQSAPITRTIRVAGEPPLVAFTAFATKDSSEPWQNGMTRVTSEGLMLTGTVQSPAGASSASFSFAGRPAQSVALTKQSDTLWGFSIPVPGDLPYEKISVTVRAADSLGREGRLASFYWNVTPLVEATNVFDAPGPRTNDIRVGSSPTGMFKVYLSDESEFRIRYMGRPLASVKLGDKTGFLNASVDGNYVIIKAVSDGISPDATIKITNVDGDESIWGPVSFLADLSDPVFEVTEPLQDSWHINSLPFAAKIADPNGIKAVEYTLDGVEWKKLETAKAEGAQDSFTAKLPLEADDGTLNIGFRVTDIAERTVTTWRAINKDATAPAGRIMLPRETDNVNGRTTSGAMFSDNGTLVSVEFSEDDGKTWEPADKLPTMTRTVDFSALGPEGKLLYRAVDKAGNVTVVQPQFTVDYEADKPRVVIQLPGDNEVLREDYAIAGAVYDDDGVEIMYWRVDEGEWQTVEVKGNTFSLPFLLEESLDNEHLFEAYSIDIYGVKGDIASRKYRISKEEPKAEMVFPPLDKTVRGIVDLSGVASDKNGIAGLQISFDNAASFNTITGTEEWGYRLDTTILKDGLHSIYIKPMDKYDTEGFYATLISIDNTAPEINLDLPGDGSTSDTKLQLSGRVSDDQYLASCEAVVFARASGDTMRSFTLSLEPVISDSLDLDGLPDGEYGVRIIAKDRAGNETLSSRDFVLKNGWRDDYIALASPVRGEIVTGRLRIQGLLRSAQLPSAVNIFVNGADTASVQPDKYGWFSIDIDPETIQPGELELGARFVTADDKTIEADKVKIEYQKTGPWILTDNFTGGAFIPERPWLRGEAGWLWNPEDELDAEGNPLDKKIVAEMKKGRDLASVDISLDNGRTWESASGRAKWKFRLETLEYREGPLPVVMRATYKNGVTAVARVLLNLDKTSPNVALLKPEPGARLNQSFQAFGTAEDDVELSSVQIALRSGDKAGYEVPGFIQGLYVEGALRGDTEWGVGFGLTFFDDNVKLQGMYGYTPRIWDGEEQRFFGHVWSAKLLANIGTLPFSFILGPDWRWLSANIALGAKFSYFSESSSETGEALTLSAVVAQLEFPRAKFNQLSMFSTYSFWVEYQAWLISAEIDGGIVSRLAFGLRMSIF